MNDELSRDEVEAQLDEKKQDISQHADALEHEAHFLSELSKTQARRIESALGYGALAGGGLLALWLLRRSPSRSGSTTGGTAVKVLLKAGLTAAAGVGLNYATKALTGKDLLTFLKDEMDEQGYTR